MPTKNDTIVSDLTSNDGSTRGEDRCQYPIEQIAFDDWWGAYAEHRFDDIINSLRHLLRSSLPFSEKVECFCVTSHQGHPILHQAILDAHVELAIGLLNTLVQTNMGFEPLMYFMQSNDGLPLFEQAVKSDCEEMITRLINCIDQLSFSMPQKLKLMFTDTDAPHFREDLFYSHKGDTLTAFKIQFRLLIYSRLQSCNKVFLLEKLDEAYRFLFNERNNPSFIIWYENYILDGFFETKDKLLLLQKYHKEQDAALLLVPKNPEVLNHVTPSLLNNRAFMRRCVMKNSGCLSYAPLSLQQDTMFLEMVNKRKGNKKISTTRSPNGKSPFFEKKTSSDERGLQKVDPGSNRRIR